MESSSLDGLLCFALYSASRLMGQKYRELLDPWGLTYTQYLVLVALWEEDGVGVGELGARLGLDSGTLSPVLKRLETRGILLRTRSRRDERAVTVTLTERGHQLQEELSGIPRRLAQETGLDADEAHETLLRVRRLTERLHPSPA